MKSVFNSFIMAFSMYSRVPMPRTEWNEDNMKYMMCFFPLVGVLIGVVIFGVDYACKILALSRVFRTAVIVLIPTIITGGIHMDGFLDTTDALKSYKPIDEKLEILKDPRAGAFAVIACVCYYILSFGIWYDVKSSFIVIPAISFVLSRAFAGLAIVSLPLAKNSGLAATFSNNAKKKVSKNMMLVYILVCIAALMIINLFLGLLCFFSALGVFIYSRYMAVKQFGGITGDVVGYFLQLCEITMTLFVMLGGNL